MACLLFYRAAVISLLGIGAGGVHSLFHPVTLKPKEPEPLPAVSHTDTPAPTAPALGLDITVAQAKTLFDADAPFLDARNTAEFEAGHVARAFHMPPDAFFGSKAPPALDLLDREKPVVAYCLGGDCHASHDVVIRLQSMGFKRCHVMVDGFPGWQKAGYEVETGPDQMGGPQ